MAQETWLQCRDLIAAAVGRGGGAQILLQKKGGLKLNSVTTMYYVSPCCFVFLVVPWLFLEYPKLSAGGPTYSMISVVLVQNNIT